MNRRQFLKFLSLIPVAIGLVKLPIGKAQDAPIDKLQPKLPKSTVGNFNDNLATIEDMLARQKLMIELIERGNLLPPANGHDYSKEELDIIRPITRQLVEEKLDRARLRELLNKKVTEILAGGGLSPL